METTVTAEQLKQLCTVIFLAGNSWKDLKMKEISLPLAAVYAGGGVLYSLLAGRPAADWLAPLGTGMLFLSLAFLTGGGIGAGDGWLMLSLGCMSGTDEYICTLCVGLFLAAFCSGILLVLLKKSRKTEIPLAPFLFLGYFGGVLL